MSKPTDEQLTALTRIISTEIQNSAGRLSKALTELDNCTGPLRATGTPTAPSTTSTRARIDNDIKPTHGDPVGEYIANGTTDDAERDRKRIERLVLDLAARSKELDGLLNIWNPSRTRQIAARGVKVTNEDIWCPNDAHGANREPRDTNRRHCRFCDGFNRDYGVMPDDRLLDAKARGRTSDRDVQACLDRAGSKKKAKVA